MRRKTDRARSTGGGKADMTQIFPAAREAEGTPGECVVRCAPGAVQADGARAVFVLLLEAEATLGAIPDLLPANKDERKKESRLWVVSRTQAANLGGRFNPIISLPHNVDPSYWKMAGPEQSPEVVVRTRILAVIDYLNRIQQK
jgi:hypothetical protein